MKELVLGTAGHIDHGKTSLIKALTGVDTDRLKEEKARGITIELGFARLGLPSGQHLGIVDVPGHEKFVKNMVAGAAGIDLVCLVIASDEGVMPQTREHLDICRLLGVRHGLVVLTKADMVDEEWMELVREDVSGFVAGSFLDGSPMVPVSSTTGEGIEELKLELDHLAGRIQESPAWGVFRLPVDRVFTMRGFGTVITGTCTGGSIELGQEVMIYPQRISSKVRGLQVHGQAVKSARKGQRTAMNLQGLEKAEINRGQVVGLPGELVPSMWMDIELKALPGAPRPLKHRAPIRMHTGAAETLGRLLLLDRDELKPGEGALCQVRLDEPTTVVAGDHFVIRSYSPVSTVAGGVVLHPNSKRHKRNRPEILNDLKILLNGEPDGRIALHARLAGRQGLLPRDLPRLVPLPAKERQSRISSLLNNRTLMRIEKDTGRMLHAKVLEELFDQVKSLLSDYHKSQPLKPGMPREELKQRLGRGMDQKLFLQLIHRLGESGELAAEKDILRLPSHKVRLTGDDAALKARFEQAYQKGGFAPPNLKDVIQGVEPKQAKEVLGVLVNQGGLVKIKEDLYYASDELQKIKDILTKHLNERGKISAADFKGLLGLSRKYVIPLLEYFDSTQVTMRVGDERVLRKG
jgi:selenocysteine-specific elongation factor